MTSVIGPSPCCGALFFSRKPKFFVLVRCVPRRSQLLKWGSSERYRIVNTPMNTERIPEDELLSRAASGDDLAVRRLLVPHIAYLARFVAHRYPILDHGISNVDDVVQETLSEALRQVNRFDPAKGSLRTWLSTIAERRARNAVRAQQRIKRGGAHQRVRQAAGTDSSLDDVVELLSAGSHTASRSAIRREAVQAVQNAIAELREDYRQAIELRLIEGKSLEEVAETMNRSPRAVQGLVDRAKKKLRAALGRLSRYE